MFCSWEPANSPKKLLSRKLRIVFSIENMAACLDHDEAFGGREGSASAAMAGTDDDDVGPNSSAAPRLDPFGQRAVPANRSRCRTSASTSAEAELPRSNRPLMPCKMPASGTGCRHDNIRGPDCLPARSARNEAAPIRVRRAGIERPGRGPRGPRNDRGDTLHHRSHRAAPQHILRARRDQPAGGIGLAALTGAMVRRPAYPGTASTIRLPNAATSGSAVTAPAPHA